MSKSYKNQAMYEKYTIGEDISQAKKVVAKYHITVIEVDGAINGQLDGSTFAHFEEEDGSKFFSFAETIEFLRHIIKDQERIQNEMIRK